MQSSPQIAPGYSYARDPLVGALMVSALGPCTRRDRFRLLTYALSIADESCE
jgi:hypothetical protein